MNAVMLHAMVDEFQKISMAGCGPKYKDSGFMDTLGDVASKVKSVAMTNVGGPQGILAPAGQIAANAKPRGGPSAGFLKFQQQNAARR